MAFLLAGACWSLAALLAGLISGTPFLRTCGAAGFVLFLGGAVVLDHFTQAPGVVEPDLWADHLRDVDWDWPRYRDEDAA